MEVAAVPDSELVRRDEDVEGRVRAREQILLVHVLTDSASVLSIAPVREHFEGRNEPRQAECRSEGKLLPKLSVKPSIYSYILKLNVFVQVD